MARIYLLATANTVHVFLFLSPFGHKIKVKTVVESSFVSYELKEHLSFCFNLIMTTAFGSEVIFSLVFALDHLLAVMVIAAKTIALRRT